MAVDARGDLYVAEQDQDRIWRVRFAVLARVTSPAPAATLLGAGFPAAAAPSVVAIRSSAFDAAGRVPLPALVPQHAAVLLRPARGVQPERRPQPRLVAN